VVQQTVVKPVGWTLPVGGMVAWLGAHWPGVVPGVIFPETKPLEGLRLNKGEQAGVAKLVVPLSQLSPE